MKRYLLIALSAFLCIALFAIPTLMASAEMPTEYWTGNGARASSFSVTANNSITITSEAELALLAYNVNAGNTYAGYTITLAKTLDLSAHLWMPIGTNNTKMFAGMFEGNNYSINGLNINITALNQGLFGYISNTGIVKNLSVSGSINCKSNYIGGIAGFNEGNISNCKSNVVMNGAAIGGDTVGGIAGTNKGTIDNCSNSGNINGLMNIGGIAGVNYGIINNSYNNGCITGIRMCAGIASTNTINYANGVYGTINNCYNNGLIVLSGNGKSGGICAVNMCTVSNSYNTAVLKANSKNSYVGGIAGYNGTATSKLTYCNNYGSFSGTAIYGKISAYNRGFILYCY